MNELSLVGVFVVEHHVKVREVLLGIVFDGLGLRAFVVIEREVSIAIRIFKVKIVFGKHVIKMCEVGNIEGCLLLACCFVLCFLFQ